MQVLFGPNLVNGKLPILVLKVFYFQVRLQMYFEGKVVVTINFNGTKTTKLSWFSIENAINSSWTDFPKGFSSRGTFGRFVSIPG